MQSAIDSNNRACSLIDINCFDEALDSLRQALAAVQNDLEEIEGSSENPSKIVKTDCTKDSPSEKHLFSSSTKRKELEGIGSFMYYHPLYVRKIPPLQGHRFLSVVIIFNFALCHHLMALQSVSQTWKTEKLMAALNLYKLAVKMQMEANFQLEMTATSFLAMVNNSAHIYEMLHRPQKAQEFRDQMLSSLMVIIENGEAHTLEEFEGFLYSASKTILRETSTAAAA